MTLKQTFGQEVSEPKEKINNQTERINFHTPSPSIIALAEVNMNSGNLNKNNQILTASSISSNSSISFEGLDSHTQNTETEILTCSKNPNEHLSKGGKVIDYQSEISTTPANCFGCNQPIMEKYLLLIGDRYWHEKCVICSVCKSPLQSKCFVRKGELLCKNDYQMYVCLAYPVARFLELHRSCIF